MNLAISIRLKETEEAVEGPELNFALRDVGAVLGEEQPPAAILPPPAAKPTAPTAISATLLQATLWELLTFIKMIARLFAFGGNVWVLNSHGGWMTELDAFYGPGRFSVGSAYAKWN